jgi:ribosomal protein L7/L12
MKITLTHAEMSALLTKQLGLGLVSNVITFEISDTPAEVKTAFLVALCKVGDVVPHNKIGAIKEYRALTNCGLREAKDVIENWNIAAAEMKRRGKFLIPLYDNGLGYGTSVDSVSYWKSV